MPISEKEKSALKMVLRLCDSRPVKVMGEPCALESTICVCALSMPRCTDELSAPALSTTIASSCPTLTSRLTPWNSTTKFWPTVKYCVAYFVWIAWTSAAPSIVSVPRAAFLTT